MKYRPSDAIESVLNYAGRVPSGELVHGPDHWTGTGVVLSRKPTGEGSLRLGLFFKELGFFHVNALGAEFSGKNGPRFGGGTEPFVWSKFKLRRSQRTHIFYIEAIDIADDMYSLRRKGETLFTVNRWSHLIKNYLPWGQPFDRLLVNLYWSMKLLDTAKISVACTDDLTADVLCGGTNWRFLWRWLKLLGLAPALRRCDCDYNNCPLFNLQRGVSCLLQQASAIELVLLDLIASLDTKPVLEILTDLEQKFCALEGSSAYLTDLFARASQWAERILTWYVK